MKWKIFIALILSQLLSVASAGDFDTCLDECTDGWATCDDKCDGSLVCIGDCATKKNFCEQECKKNDSNAQYSLKSRVASEQRNTYFFSYRNPPTFNDGYDVLEMSEDQLGKTVGTASWEDSKEVRTSAAFYEWKRTDVKIFVERRFQWRLKNQYRFAHDTPIELQSSQGYEKENMEAAERIIKSTYGVSAGYSDYFKLTSSHEDQLKITNSSKDVWKTQSSEKVTQVFLAEKTYSVWQLLEVRNFTFTINEKTLLGTQKNVVKVFPTRIEKVQIRAILSPYWVDEGDPNGELQKRSAEKTSFLINKQISNIN